MNFSPAMGAGGSGGKRENWSPGTEKKVGLCSECVSDFGGVVKGAA